MPVSRRRPNDIEKPKCQSTTAAAIPSIPNASAFRDEIRPDSSRHRRTGQHILLSPTDFKDETQCREDSRRECPEKVSPPSPSDFRDRPHHRDDPCRQCKAKDSLSSASDFKDKTSLRGERRRHDENRRQHTGKVSHLPGPGLKDKTRRTDTSRRQRTEQVSCPPSSNFGYESLPKARSREGFPSPPYLSELEASDLRNETRCHHNSRRRRPEKVSPPYLTRSKRPMKTAFIDPNDIKMAEQQLHREELSPSQRKEQEEWAQKIIQELGVCPGSYRWVRAEGPDEYWPDWVGYRCQFGTHFMTDELVAEGKGGYYHRMVGNAGSGPQGEMSAPNIISPIHGPIYSEEQFQQVAKQLYEIYGDSIEGREGFNLGDIGIAGYPHTGQESSAGGSCDVGSFGGGFGSHLGW